MFNEFQVSTNVLNYSIPALVVVCGPTATGKSSTAIALAQQLRGVILSADSRQVYRDFDIGTAKPTRAEQQQVPHYLIDVCDPRYVLTVADYQLQAQSLVAKFHHEWLGSASVDAVREIAPALPLLVGGTGLYIRSVTRGLKIPRVPPQAELRSQLNQLGQHQCYSLLQKMDPSAADKIHPNDAVRTIRALEVGYTTGRPMSEQQGEQPPKYPILQIGLDCNLNETPTPECDRLTQRIAQRTHQMVNDGFVEEVERLCQIYGDDLPLLNTLGYQEFKRYLKGEISQTDAIAQTILHTRQFAKRQRTWFRADSSITWFDSDRPDLQEALLLHIQRFFEQ